MMANPASEANRGDRASATVGAFAVVLLLALDPAIAAEAFEPAAAIVVVAPADGSTLQGPKVTIEVRVTGFTLQKPGSGNRVGAGHIHYWIDDFYSPMLASATAETRFTLIVPPGRHNLRAELVADDHTSLAPGYLGQGIGVIPADPSFTHRPTMATITIDVR